MEISYLMNYVIFFISAQCVVAEGSELHDTVIGLFVGITIAFIMLVSAIVISCKIFVCVNRSSQGSVLQQSAQQTSLMSSNSPHSLTNPLYNYDGSTSHPGVASGNPTHPGVPGNPTHPGVAGNTYQPEVAGNTSQPGVAGNTSQPGVAGNTSQPGAAGVY